MATKREKAKAEHKTVALKVEDINKAKPTDKPCYLFDGGGLYLEVNPEKKGGSRLWKMQARLNGKLIKMSFGKYPAVSLQDARKKRLEAQELIAKGINPNEAKKAARAAEKARTEHTFEKVARAWYDLRKGGWQESTANYIIRRLEANIFPVIGDLPINEIRVPHIKRALQAIEQRGAGETARRVKTVVAKIFRYAISNEIADRNPADIDNDDIFSPRQKKHHASIKPDELPGLLKAIDTNSINMSFYTRTAINLMMLLFIRTDELIAGEWSEIDLETGVWVIPWQRMKMGGRKINPDMTDHRIDLPRQAVALLKDLLPYSGGGKYLFPSHRDRSKTGHISNMAILRALDRMGYKGKMTGHGFRALATSWLDEQKTPNGGKRFSREAIERQLAHKEKGTTDPAYHRGEFQKERKEMLQAWADHIDALRRRNLKLVA